MLSLFEFVTVMISMVLALALGQLLLGVSSLVKSGRETLPFLPHSLWLGCLFLVIVNSWWVLWDYRELEWTYPSFFFVILQPTLLFFAVGLLVPDRAESGAMNLKEYFLGVRLLFMGTMLAFTICTWFDGPILRDQDALGGFGLLHVPLIGFLLVGLLAESAAVHTLVAGGYVLITLMFMSLRFLPGAFG